MAEVIRLVCDKCGTLDDVGAYRLSTPATGPNRTLALDLCTSCAKPLLDFEPIGRVVTRANRRQTKARQGRSGETLRARIYTQEELDEIEAETAP